MKECRHLSNQCNDIVGLLKNAVSASLNRIYAALLILIQEQPLSSINALPKFCLILVEIAHFEVSWVYIV
ncbi:hypothetical protein CJF42_01100 [Pseudoalteromonas sp. NBT06-2]|nr:hypothetical protein CJF42_01100 [Pseudoalteromonas sp. NBT06-2]